MSLFTPAAKLFNLLQFRTKFLLFITLMGILMLTILSIIIIQIKEEINKSTLEQYGLKYSKLATDLLINTQKTRGLTNVYMNGNTSVLYQIQDLKENNLKLLKTLDLLNEDYTEVFSTNAKYTSLKSKLILHNKNALSQKASTAFSTYTSIIHDISKFIIHISDYSNLGLDPELHTAYMSNLLIKRIPIIIFK